VIATLALAALCVVAVAVVVAADVWMDRHGWY
jgi:hypothetical protein